jgi:hypothetical protein
MRRACFNVVLLVVLSPLARAGQVTLTFDGLTDGQSLTSCVTQGFRVDDPHGFTAIGPGDSFYLEAVGLHPLGNDFSITRVDGASFVVTLLGFSFGFLGRSGEIDTDTFGRESGQTLYIILIDTTNGLNPDAPQNPLPPVNLLDVSFSNYDPPFQVTQMRLGFHVVPEPSTLLLAALGGTLSLGYGCCRRRGRATCLVRQRVR